MKRAKTFFKVIRTIHSHCALCAAARVARDGPPARHRWAAGHARTLLSSRYEAARATPNREVAPAVTAA